MPGDPFPGYGPIARRRAARHVAHGETVYGRARRRPPSKLGLVARIFGALTVILIFAVIIGLTVLSRASSGRIIPNVSVRGLNISQMTPDMARAALRHQYAGFVASPISFQFEDRIWRASPEQLGITVEIDESRDEGPLCIEYSSRQPVPLSDARHPVLGAVFKRHPAQ